MAGDRKKPSLFTIPPLYFALAIVSMFLLHRFLPIIDVINPPFSRFGWLVIAGGIALAAWGRLRFARAGTAVVPFSPSTALVTDGPFRFTRNPMYLGMMLVLIGGFVLAGSLGSLVVIPVFFWWIHTRFVLPEEDHMADHFGDAYRAYQRRVRRWL